MKKRENRMISTQRQKGILVLHTEQTVNTVKPHSFEQADP